MSRGEEANWTLNPSFRTYELCCLRNNDSFWDYFLDNIATHKWIDFFVFNRFTFFLINTLRVIPIYNYTRKLIVFYFVKRSTYSSFLENQTHCAIHIRRVYYVKKTSVRFSPFSLLIFEHANGRHTYQAQKICQKQCFATTIIKLHFFFFVCVWITSK